ncbi:hypothetical protein [Pontibacillus yanchengensis]|uniref:Uncharacterized protein n=1 Tax=Pontibacillus yanchengensis Y32 TaxID=1385514 RepID=A0A0A2TKD5_9BACI|nr:hypothetical protein [Pontibacillus yanchengensis]KGP74551.1 hypothetical protein N782_00210 [Pontibacillus yanchengensis Y32]
MSKEKKQDKAKAQEESEEWLEELLGLDKEEVFIDFKCKECGEIDKVPEYVIDEFSVDLKPGEEVELHCPVCNGTITRAKDAPSE